jgi:hypothetical protein
MHRKFSRKGIRNAHSHPGIHSRVFVLTLIAGSSVAFIRQGNATAPEPMWDPSQVQVFYQYFDNGSADATSLERETDHYLGHLDERCDVQVSSGSSLATNGTRLSVTVAFRCPIDVDTSGILVENP